MKNQGSALKFFLGVFFLNGLLAFPILYLVYKHYNPLISPMDMNIFMDMVRHGMSEVEPPFRYRVVTAFLVKAMTFLPGYDISIVYSSDPAVKKEFFHFLVLNCFLTVTTSALLFLYLRDKLQPAFAYLGSVLYLFSFCAVLVNIIPMSDATCQLAIMVCVLSMEKNKPVWFALALLVGVFAKETIFFIIPVWILIRIFSDRLHRARHGVYLVYLLPAVLIYYAVTRLYPLPSSQLYYHAGFLLGNIFAGFNPTHYDRSLIFHVFLSQLPLLASLMAFVYLRIFRNVRDISLNPELILLPFLIWVGGATGLGNNTARLMFLAFPASIYFEALVIQTLALRLGFSKTDAV